MTDTAYVVTFDVVPEDRRSWHRFRRLLEKRQRRIGAATGGLLLSMPLAMLVMSHWIDAGSLSPWWLAGIPVVGGGMWWAGQWVAAPSGCPSRPMRPRQPS